MRFISIILIFCHLLLLYQPTYAIQQQTEMQITFVKQDSLIANQGSNHGISVGMLYDIRQGDIIIGTAEVMVVKASMCGLKLREIKRGYIPKIGDTLSLSERISGEQQSILEEMRDAEFTPEKLTKRESKSEYHSSSDYYFEGQAAADDDYGSAFGGGFLAGLLGGLIGWGIGYAIVSSQGADIPPHYLTDLENNERLQFSSGYKEKIKSKRKSTFNAGALTGTLIVVAVVIAANSSQ